jgi:hypothetical protein
MLPGQREEEPIIYPGKLAPELAAFFLTGAGGCVNLLSSKLMTNAQR